MNMTRWMRLLLVIACVVLAGCASRSISPVTQAAVAGKLRVGQQVHFTTHTYYTRSIRIREIRETCLVSDAGEEIPYADMAALEYQVARRHPLVDTDRFGVLAWPLVPVAAVVIVVGGTVILVGSVTCFVLTGSAKCGALLTS